MEREDSFEAIVANAVHEVQRNRLLWRSSVKSLLFLVTFMAALEALRHPKSRRLSHTVGGNSSYGESSLWRVVDFVASLPVPAVRTGPAGENPRPSKAWTGPVVNKRDAMARATVIRRGATNIS